MSKQDGYSPRTAADLERKYKFGQTFAKVYGLAEDARKAAEEAKTAFEGLDHEEIFNRLTNNGEWQGIYRDEEGNVYINATYIKGGELDCSEVKLKNLTIDLSGKISFDDLTDADDVRADFGITEAKAATLITDKLVAAPKIAGAIFMNDEQDFGMKMFGYDNHWSVDFYELENGAEKSVKFSIERNRNSNKVLFSAVSSNNTRKQLFELDPDNDKVWFYHKVDFTNATVFGI